MIHDRANWLSGMRRTVLALTAATLSFAYPDVPAAHAQSVMRSPNLNIQSRMPAINPTVTTRINPTIAARPVTTIGRTPRIGVTLPKARFSPNLSPACSYAHRDSSGECQDKPVVASDSGGGKSTNGGDAGKSTRNGKNGGAGRNAPLAAPHCRRSRFRSRRRNIRPPSRAPMRRPRTKRPS